MQYPRTESHELRYQVLGEADDVRSNELFVSPLIRLLEEIESRFKARIEEREVQVGLFRVPIPDFSLIGFREALVNAMIHRDYSRREAVHFQWKPDAITIANPGGLPEGITLDNILVHEPKPRNPRLAETFRRLGLSELTARGVDRIFFGQLTYGRTLPDYTGSDPRNVRVVLQGGPASTEFAAFVFEQQKNGRPLSLNELLVIRTLYEERHLKTDEAARVIQKRGSEAKRVLEKLNERGLIEAKGEGRGRAYHLSAEVYRKLGLKSQYVRTHGISQIRHEALVLECVNAHGRVTRKEVMDLCGLQDFAATRLLRRMCDKGVLKSNGKGRRWTFYTTP